MSEEHLAWHTYTVGICTRRTTWMPTRIRARGTFAGPTRPSGTDRARRETVFARTTDGAFDFGWSVGVNWLLAAALGPSRPAFDRLLGVRAVDGGLLGRRGHGHGHTWVVLQLRLVRYMLRVLGVRVLLFRGALTAHGLRRQCAGQAMHRGLGHCAVGIADCTTSSALLQGRLAKERGSALLVVRKAVL